MSRPSELVLVNECPDGFAHAHTHYIAEHIQIENQDRKLVVAAHGHRRRVQHLQGFRQHVVIADFRKQDGVVVPQRILVIDSVYARALGDDIGVDFERAQRGRSVGGKIRIGSSSRENHDAALFEMTNGPAADVRLSHLMDLDGGHHARWNAGLLERILQGYGVDHGGKHPHVVRRYTVHLHGSRRNAPKEIASAYHQPDLHAGPGYVSDLVRQAFDTLRIDAESASAGENFTAQLEDDALIFRHGDRAASSRSRLPRPLAGTSPPSLQSTPLLPP